MTRTDHRRGLGKVLAAMALGLVLVLAACSGGEPAAGESSETPEPTAVPRTITIAVPSDAVDEGRAFRLLADQGLIRLTDGMGFNATLDDIVENPNDIQFIEVDAATAPTMLSGVDFAVLGARDALIANIDPKTTLATEPMESAATASMNVVAANATETGAPKIAVFLTALESQTAKDAIANASKGGFVPVFETVEGATIPEATDDNVIRVGTLRTPYSDILASVQPMLSQKGWELQIREFADAIQANDALMGGELDANYLQSAAALDVYNAQNDTALQSVAAISFEPLGLYGGKRSSLEGLVVLN